MSENPKALFLLDDVAREQIYPATVRRDIERLVEFVSKPLTAATLPDNGSALSDVELLFSGWGAPPLDEDFLERIPQLQIVFYGAGSIRGLMTESAWNRGIQITSAYGANAVAVAEFTLSQIIFCLKLGWQHMLALQWDHRYVRLENVPGALGTTVGIIALGQIGQRVCRRLQGFDVQVIAHDPYFSEAAAAELGAELMDLESIFRRSDVVSLHAPLLPETQGMITGRHLSLLKPQASFINTARGGLVKENELIEVLQARPDLIAVLDVTSPEPPETDSPLWDLRNAILLPHISGSMHGECRRLGECMVDELRRYVAGEPLRWRIHRDQAARLA